MINIKKINLVHEDDRGDIHSFNLSDNSDQLMFVRRNKNSVSGKHYHKGDDKSKNPEKFIVISGRVKFAIFDLSTKEYREIVVKPFENVEINANVYHEMLALEETVFMEIKYGNDEYKDVCRLNAVQQKELDQARGKNAI